MCRCEGVAKLSQVLDVGYPVLNLQKLDNPQAHCLLYCSDVDS